MLRRTKAKPAQGLVAPARDPEVALEGREGAVPGAVDHPGGSGADTGAAEAGGSPFQTYDRDLPRRALIGEILMEQGLLSQEQLNAALAAQSAANSEAEDKRRLGEVLRAAHVINEEQLVAALLEQFGIKQASLERISFDPAAISLLPEAMAREVSAVPLAKSKDSVSVAVSDPGRPGLLGDLEDVIGLPVTVAYAPEDAVAVAIEKAYKAAAAVTDAVRVFEARTAERASTGPETIEVDANAPAVQVVTQILTQAMRDRASDVHIEPMGERVRVRNRVDGALHEVLSLPQSMAQALVSRIKIMADMNIVERRRPQDGQISTVIDGAELDIRVSTTSTVNGEKTVLRLLDKSRALYDLATLGMPEDIADVYKDVIRSPYGMVVCAGPTGSGKTTTLYATLMAINNDEINVMTVEDPVEYTFPTINQIGINEQAGVTFAAGLRSILRQDPDAVLVGEIRDVETARIAIQAALTGHFVLSTIHATDATSALHRFLDMGIESFLLASSMLAVVGQRLIRKSCEHCLAPYEPSLEDAAFYERAGGKPKDVFMKGAGCSECASTGYMGRIGVYEVLRLTDEMRELVVRNATLEEIRAMAIDQGMVPMRDQALQLVADDVTTIAEVMRTIYIL